MVNGDPSNFHQPVISVKTHERDSAQAPISLFERFLCCMVFGIVNPLSLATTRVLPIISIAPTSKWSLDCVPPPRSLHSGRTRRRICQIASRGVARPVRHNRRFSRAFTVTSTASRSSHPHALQAMNEIRPLPTAKHSLVAAVLGVGGRISWVIALFGLSREHADLWIAHRPAYLGGHCTAGMRLEPVGQHGLSLTHTQSLKGYSCRSPPSLGYLAFFPR